MPLSQLISVIIPFYSKESGRLISAVTSALNQTNCTVEVIVVDDCSPISAKSELKQINDPRVKIIRHEKNSNGGIARNTGVNNAQGQFIAFLDYDDVWYDNKLEKQLNLYNEKSKNFNPEVVIYSRCKIIDGSREFIRPTRAIHDKETVAEYLFSAQELIQTSGIFLSKELAKKVPFHDLKRHQDYQFCLSLEEADVKFVFSNEVAYEFIQIHKLNDFTFSLSWLEGYKYLMSKKAVKGFNYLVILRSMIAAKQYNIALGFAMKKRMPHLFIKSLVLLNLKKLLKWTGVLK
ncbi:glycosyltransferase family 2 protein [Pseudoalteromonas sp. HL-AS2]|uniref:glycosyltransferase family 2 protein n=1 Tax=Pseudoalteromonas sp. HL-AS2 TaxID=3071082 RepID=UPI002814A79C|nr:glycosyltransferase family 2 protein [Pseudoalteromonas sp. HL-AS2]WMS95909.1 glycosyltransferase family 2 protein [Pseudoalteromonas sp. HL-AS2]